MGSPPPTLGSIAEGPLSLSSSGGLSWKSAEERGGRWDDGPSPQPPRPNVAQRHRGKGRRGYDHSLQVLRRATERIEVI